MDDRRYVQPASSVDIGWEGTASAEPDVVAGVPSLYNVTGLDRKKWTILGLDIMASHRWPDVVRVHAVSRSPGDGREALRVLNEREGGVPVTTFIVRGLSERDVIDCMKTYSVALRSKNFSTMYVVDEVEVDKAAR